MAVTGRRASSSHGGKLPLRKAALARLRQLDLHTVAGRDPCVENENTQSLHRSWRNDMRASAERMAFGPLLLISSFEQRDPLPYTNHDERYLLRWKG